MMHTFRFKKFMVMVLLLNFYQLSFAIPEEFRVKGFVYLHEIDPTIQFSLRYFSNDNFVGKSVDGYNKNVVILTEPTAKALKEVQKEVNKDGYELVVYDAYRPQQAVDHFIRWSKDHSDQNKKLDYYPRVNKEDVFDLGYVCKKSGHSRGSTVDLTLIKKGSKVQSIQRKTKTLKDGFEITFLDDGTVDAGSSFDLFDKASHFINNLITDEQQKIRTYLKTVMEKYGFKPYAEEWWHFTLKDEPFTADRDDSYFNFPLEL